MKNAWTLNGRVVKCLRCKSTVTNFSFGMDQPPSLQLGSKGNNPNHYCYQDRFLNDSAILQCGRIINEHGNREPRGTKWQNKERFRRTSVPYSPKLLENSFTCTQSQKRKTHTSGDSCQKLAWKDKKLDSEVENIDPDHAVTSFVLGREFARKRQWELTSLGAQHLHRPYSGFEFSVLSYNVLAQNLLEDNIYLYRDSDKQVLAWNYRSKQLLLEFHELKADILCLQEVNELHYHDFFEPELKKMGYKGVYLKRTGDKFDGCATFYKTDKFALIESLHVPYYKSNCSLLDRDNVGLIVKLRPHIHHYSQEDNICVANTHLLFNPRRGDIKLAQAMCLLTEVKRVARTERNSLCQVILCGDFNSTPFSDLYKFLVQGYLRYEGLLTRTISGQKDGRFGKDRYLERNFFPSKHNISDQCEYIQSEDRGHLERPGQERYGHRSQGHVSQSSGCLWHYLNLVSTHCHTIERLGHVEREVTTQHSADACTVDYIFYNVAHRDVHTRRNKHRTSNLVEGKLKLLGRLGLMSSGEISELGNLPNNYNPSDHLPMLVKFILL